MHEEYATSFRVIYGVSLITFVLLAIALVLIFYNALTEPIGNQYLAPIVLVFIAAATAAGIAAFCHDMVKGMRKRGMIT